MLLVALQIPVDERTGYRRGAVGYAAIVDLLEAPFVAAAAVTIVRVPDISARGKRGRGQISKMLLVVEYADEWR